MSTIQAAEILTTTGRAFVEERVARAEDAVVRMEERLRHERTPDLVAEHRSLLHEVDELRAVLARALDVRAVAEDPSIVEVGDEVDVEEAEGGMVTYALVHPAEVRSADRRVTAGSPLGQALLGSRPGDAVRVEAPAGAYTVTVRQRRRLM